MPQTNNIGYSNVQGMTFQKSHLDAHLITPSDTSENRAERRHLLHIRCWVNLTHADTFIHGPFNFATVNGRETWDCVGQKAWDMLTAKTSLLSNPIPKFDLPLYSIHVDRGIHTTYRMIAAVQDSQPSLPSL